MSEEGGQCKECKFCLHDEWYCTIYDKTVEPNGPLEVCHAMRPE